MDRQAGRTGAGMQAASRAMAAGGAAIIGAMGLAVKATAEFEKELSTFKAVTGATAGEVDKMRKKALQLGRDTAYSAKESAGAITELGKAGLSTADILGGAADATVALAAAGDVEMGRAAEIAASTMAQFSLAAEELPKVADLLAGAANASTAGVEDLAEGLKYVGPLASATGTSLEDTATAMAALSNNGIKGSMAGTTLRQMLITLQPQSDKAATAMEELGFITEDGANKFFTAEGKMKDLGEVAQILQDGLSGLSEKQKAAALDTIFGSRAMAGATALAKEGEKGFSDLAGAIGKITAEDVAEERLNNLSGSMTILKGSVETAAITFASASQGPLKAFVDRITEAVNWFATLSPKIQQVAFIVAGAVGAFLLVGGAIGMMYQPMKLAAAGFRLMASSAMGFLANPIVIALALIVGALVLAYRHSETFREIVHRAFSTVKGVVEDVLGAIERFKTGLQRGIDGRPISKGLEPVVAIGDRVGRAIRDGFGIAKRVFEGFVSVVDTVSGAIDNVRKAFNVAGDEGAAGLLQDMGGLEAIFGRVIGFIQTTAVPFLQEMGTRLRATFAELAPTLRAGFDAIKAVVGAVVSFILGIWQRFGQRFISFIVTALSIAWQTFKGVFRGIMNIISGVIEFFKGFFNVIAGIFTGDWKRVWEGVKSMFAGAWRAVTGILRVAWSVISGLFRQGVNAVTMLLRAGLAVIDSLWDWLFERIRDIVVGIWQWINQKWQEGLASVQNELRTARDTIVNTFTSLRDSVGRVWDDVRAKIAAPLNVAIGGINDFISGVNTIASRLGLGFEIPLIPQIQYHQGGVVGSGGQRRPENKNLRRNEEVAVLLKNERVLSPEESRMWEKFDPNAIRWVGEGGGMFSRLRDMAMNALETARRAIANVVRPALEAVMARFASGGGTGLSGLLGNVGQSLGKRILDWVGGAETAIKNAVPDFSGSIVALGRQLQKMGFHVAEHPAFGGVAPVHSPNSYHYQGRALDVNYYPAGNEPGKLDFLYNWIKENVTGVQELLWRVAGHYGHLHVAMANGGAFTRPFTGMVTMGETLRSRPEIVAPQPFIEAAVAAGIAKAGAGRSGPLIDTVNNYTTADPLHMAAELDWRMSHAR